MSDVFQRLFRKYFSDPEGVILAIVLLVGFGVIIYFGKMLAPVLASIVMAYLLDSVVGALMKRGMPRFPAVLVVFVPFLAFLMFLLLGVLPLISGQITELVQMLPSMIARGQQLLLLLPEQYPNFITEAQVQEIMQQIRATVGGLGQRAVALSLATITSVVTLIVYLVLFPVLVFFFLKDKALILEWISQYLPRERGLMTRIWLETEQQIGNYVRGKFVEILIVGAVSFLVFTLLGLNFAMLLGALVGLSVIVPYIGAVVVTFPIAFIAYFQWGWGAELAYIMIAYAVIQAVDGNILAPLLFSKVVNLHPITIIIAVLIFGGIWGFWGVFFAIPLATLIKALINAWPRALEEVIPSEMPASQRSPPG